MKVSLPSPLFFQIYYWISQISLILTWLITPLFLYLIFTQSKQLKSFKWFILNHSFWSVAFETLIGLFKPVFLFPAFAGFPATIIHENGDYHSSAIAITFGLFFGINYTASICVTICNRYMTTFPSKFTNWITRKFIIIVACFCLLCIYIPLFIAIIPALSKTDFTEIIAEAKSYDDFFHSFQDPSVFFVSTESVKIALIVVLFCLFFVDFLGIIVIFVFKYLIRENSTVSVTKIQRSMIISSVVQISLSTLFLNLPIATMILLILFEVPHSSKYACICLSLISVHAVLEFLATFYFVLPYRKFFQNKFRKILVRNSSTTVRLVTVPPVSSVILK